MKPRNIVTKLVLCTLIISLCTGFAFAGKDVETITGVVSKTDAGFVITTTDGKYSATGADLVAAIGKKVEATGKVTEGDAGKAINVLAIKEVKK